MDRTANKLREKLATGGCVTGAAVFSWSPYVVDVAGTAGLDYLRIDTEHAWRKDETIEHLIRAAIRGGGGPIVRVDRDDPYLVRKALEIEIGKPLPHTVDELIRRLEAIPGVVRGHLDGTPTPED